MRLVYLVGIILFAVACMPIRHNGYIVEVTPNSVDKGLFKIPENTTLNFNDSVWYGQVQRTVSRVYLYSYQVHTPSIIAYRYHLSGVPVDSNIQLPQWAVIKGRLLINENVQVEELAHWKTVDEEYPGALKKCNRFVNNQLHIIDKQASAFLNNKLQAVFFSVPYFETNQLIFVDEASHIMGIKCGEKRVNTTDNSIQYFSYIVLYNFVDNTIDKVNIIHYND